jgi:hypothetical protein
MLARLLLGLILLVGVGLLAPLPGWSATNFVQSKTASTCCAPTSHSVTFDSNVTAGNLIALGIYTNGDSGSFVSVSSVSGSSCQSNTFTSSGTNPQADVVGNGQMFLYYAKNISGGACTITVTVSAAVVILRLHVQEISGADTAAPLDKTSGQFQNNPGLGTNAISSGSQTTTTNGQYIFGFTCNGNGGSTLSAGTGFTIRDQDGASAGEWQVQTSAGSIAATFTQSGEMGNHLTGMMTFKEAAAGVNTDFFRRRINQ